MKRLIVFFCMVAFLFCSEAVVNATMLISTLETLTPDFNEYVFDVDQKPFRGSAVGDVTAILDYVPDYGDELDDFSAFTSGCIALIERGGVDPIGTFFSQKILKAQDAGAVGLIIFDDPDQVFEDVTFGGPMASIPSVFVTRTVGEELLGYFNSDETLVHLEVAPIPDPSTILLLGSGLVGLAGFRRKFRK